MVLVKIAEYIRKTKKNPKNKKQKISGTMAGEPELSLWNHVFCCPCCFYFWNVFWCSSCFNGVGEICKKKQNISKTKNRKTKQQKISGTMAGEPELSLWKHFLWCCLCFLFLYFCWGCFLDVFLMVLGSIFDQFFNDFSLFFASLFRDHFLMIFLLFPNRFLNRANPKISKIHLVFICYSALGTFRKRSIFQRFSIQTST